MANAIESAGGNIIDRRPEYLRPTLVVLWLICLGFVFYKTTSPTTLKDLYRSYGHNENVITTLENSAGRAAHVLRLSRGNNENEIVLSEMIVDSTSINDRDILNGLPSMPFLRKAYAVMDKDATVRVAILASGEKKDRYRIVETALVIMGSVWFVSLILLTCIVVMGLWKGGWWEDALRNFTITVLYLIGALHGGIIALQGGWLASPLGGVTALAVPVLLAHAGLSEVDRGIRWAPYVILPFWFLIAGVAGSAMANLVANEGTQLAMPWIIDSIWYWGLYVVSLGISMFSFTGRTMMRRPQASS